MKNEPYTAGDQILRVEFGDDKETGVIGCIFTTARGQRIRVLFAKKDVPAFVAKLVERYKSSLD